MARRLTSYPVLALATAAILIAGCIEPLSPSSHATRDAASPAVGAVSTATPGAAADAHGWAAFYPLAVGNHWLYATRLTMQVVPTLGPPQDPVTIDGTTTHDMLCANQVTGLEYVSERVSWQQAGESGESWITSRQDRSGLFELGEVGITGCTSASATTRPGAALAAAARARAWQIASSRLDPSARAGWLAAWPRAEAKLAALDVALGRATSAAAGGGSPLPGEITRLSYPLHPGATWTIRPDPLFQSTVDAVEQLKLPIGGFKAYRIAIHSVLFGPSDNVLTWYGPDGYLGLEAYSELVAIDTNGNLIGTLKTWQSERLTDLSIGGASASATSDPVDVQVGRH